MLVLTRKVQEAVVVGGTPGCERVLRVTVLEITGGTVRLGFEAAANVPVNREEVLERMLASGPRPPPPQDPAATVPK